MAYSAPRTWDGTETTNVPTYLETIRSNNAALHARLPVVNIGFYGAELTNSGSGGQKVWIMQHRLRYLHYHLECTQSTLDDVRLYVTVDLSSLGSNLISHGGSYSDGDLMTSSGNDSGSAVDLNALTVGNWYFVVVQYTAAGGSSGERLFVRNLYESSES